MLSDQGGGGTRGVLSKSTGMPEMGTEGQEGDVQHPHDGQAVGDIAGGQQGHGGPGASGYFQEETGWAGKL